MPDGLAVPVIRHRAFAVHPLPRARELFQAVKIRRENRLIEKGEVTGPEEFKEITIYPYAGGNIVVVTSPPVYHEARPLLDHLPCFGRQFRQASRRLFIYVEVDHSVGSRIVDPVFFLQ